MKLFIFSICLMSLMLSTENAPQNSETNEVINNDSESESVEIEPAVFEESFIVNVQLDNANNREINILGTENFQSLIMHMEETDAYTEENIVVDFKNSYSLTTDKDFKYCILSKISHVLDYKTEVASLKAIDSDFVLDSAVCDYEIIEQSSLSQYGGPAEALCSSNKTLILIEFIGCETTSHDDDSTQIYPKKVLSKVTETCKFVSYVCNEIQQCTVVCLKTAINLETSYDEEQFAVGTENGDIGILKGGIYHSDESSGIYSTVQIAGLSTGYLYLGTIYLDVTKEFSVSVSILDNECAVVDLPEGTTIDKFVTDFSEDSSRISPVIQCTVDDNLPLEKVEKSALFNVACKGLKHVHVHDCQHISEEEFSKGFECTFASLMYFGGEASLYCITE